MLPFQAHACPTLNAFFFAAFVTTTKVFYSLLTCSVTLLPPLKEEGHSPFLTADLLNIWASKGEWGHCLCWKIQRLSLYITVQSHKEQKRLFVRCFVSFVGLSHSFSPVWPPHTPTRAARCRAAARQQRACSGNRSSAPQQTGRGRRNKIQCSSKI